MLEGEGEGITCRGRWGEGEEIVRRGVGVGVIERGETSRGRIVVVKITS